MKKFKLGIADDHLLFAEGISNIITQRNDLELCFITNNAGTLIHLINEHKIDFLLLDVNLPPANGLDLLKQIKKLEKNIRIMILSMYQPSDIHLNIHDFTGDAYVLKISGKQILEAAIESMKNNIRYIDPNIHQEVPLQDAFTNQLKLSKREKEIIALIAAGKTSKEIAAELYLSELTIKTHRKNISEKLGTKGMADLIAKGIQMNKS